MRYLLIFVVSGLFASSSFAQCGLCAINDTCTVDPPYPTTCPLVPPPGTVGVPLSLDVTFWIPPEFQDVVSGLTVSIDQITVTSITDIPLGLTFQPNDADLIYYPQEQPFGCVRVCGTPMVPGFDTVRVNVTALATVGGLNVTQERTLNIPLTIIMSDDPNIGFTFEPDSTCAPLTVEFEPLISAQGLTSSYDWDFGNGTTYTGDAPPAQTYDAGEHIVTLETTITAPFLTQAALTAVNGNWCGDLDEPNIPIVGCIGQPDIYFTLTDANNGTQRSNTIANDQTPNWNGLEMALNFPPYTLRFFDSDDLSDDDLLGTYTLPSGVGAFPFSLSGTNGSVQVQIQTVQTFEDIDTVVVFPVPDVTLTLDLSDTTLCAAEQDLTSYVWLLDGDTVADVTGPCAEVSDGEWTVIGTNVFGCSSSSSFTVTGVGLVDLRGAIPSWSLYPVPNQGLFTVHGRSIRTAGPLWLRVLDASGRTVFEERSISTSDQFSLVMDLRGTAPGAYVLKISDEHGTYNRSFIVAFSH